MGEGGGGDSGGAGDDNNNKNKTGDKKGESSKQLSTDCQLTRAALENIPGDLLD